MIPARLGLRVMVASLAVSIWTSPVHAAPEDVAQLRATLDQAVAVYAADPERAREIAGDAFLRFETSGLDRLLAARDPATYR